MTTRPADAPTVVLCGLATLDLVQTVERLPAPDEKVVAQELHVAAGGPATNAAVTAAALGVRAVLVTRVGDGPLADAVLADLAQHEVEVRDLARPGWAPAVSTVLVTAGTGERAVVSVNATGSREAGGDDGATVAGPQARRGALDLVDVLDVLEGAAVLLVDGHHLDLAVPMAREARRVGVPVLLDGGSWKPGLEQLLELVDVAVVSADLRVPADLRVSARVMPADPAAPDAPRLSTLSRLAALGPAVVACSRGGDPMTVLTIRPMRAQGVVVVPSVKVVDTLGAGDVLHGALAAWWALHPGTTAASGLPVWEEALSAAAAVASSSCTGAGARGWLADAGRLAEARADVRPQPSR